MDISLAIPNEVMFERIGLTKPPFPVTPDAEHYYCSQRLELHILEIIHCIHLRKGFLLFTADVGLGKTTLSRYLINSLEKQNTNISLVLNTFLQGVELLRAINEDFSLNIEGGFKEQLDGLNKFLLEQYQDNKNCLIIIDDAQNLSVESLEMIRLISNFELNTCKLVQILLIAQPEIMLTLDLPEIRQLKSRIALHVELTAFSKAEVADYVRFRLDGAGNYHGIALLPKAVKKLCLLSKGYPRRINMIMDRALYVLMASKNNLIDGKTITLANNDLLRVQNLTRANSKSLNSKNKLYLLSVAVLLGVILVFFSETWLEKTNLKSLFVNEVKTNLTLPDISQAITKVTIESKPETVIEVALESENVSYDLAEKERVELSEKIARNEALVRFLSSYKEEELYSRVAVFFDQQNWTELGNVFSEHGWELLINKQPFVQPPRDVLKQVTYSGSEYWLMLWKPQLYFENYYFGLRSKEVKVLQELLKREGFFTDVVDSVLGSYTIRAVSRFQLSLGLKPTGRADALTLYFLTKDNSTLAMLM